MLLYCVHERENGSHNQGLVLMLSEEGRNAIIGLESHGSRIIRASLKTKKEVITMNIIQCYVPISDSNDDDMDQFFTTGCSQS